MEHEIWKSVPNYTRYEVSNYGRVRSLDWVDIFIMRGKLVSRLKRGRILRPGVQKCNGKPNRLWVMLFRENEKFHVAVSHVVLAAFVGPRPDGMEACHWDGNIFNNSDKNLRWDTHQANMDDAKRHGTVDCSHLHGERHWKAKITSEIAKYIKNQYAEGAGVSHMAKFYKISVSSVESIVYGRCWKSA